MARPKTYHITLTDDEFKQLKSVIRKKQTSRTVRCRCQIITINTNYLQEMYYNQHLDNIGPAYCSSLEVLEKAIKSIRGVK